jgi:hypothetical protein
MPDPDVAPDLDQYLPEPEFDGDQEDHPADLLVAARTLITPTAPRDLSEAIAWFAGQITSPSKDWTNRCQEFSRTGPGCPGGSASALDAFFNCPSEYRIVGGDVTKLEPGWQAVSRSNNTGSTMAKFGHIFPIVRDFSDGRQGGISTDALRRGKPDKINPSDLYDQWDHDYVGAVRWQNGKILDVKNPKPVQDHRYDRADDAVVDLERAITDLAAARDKAKKQGDWHDRDDWRDLLRRVKRVRNDVRDAADTLRRVG